MRGFDAPPDEPRLAELLRDVTARNWSGDGSYRGDEGHVRSWRAAQLHFAGIVPPGTKSSRGLLENIQFAVPWRCGRAGAILPGLV